MIGWTEKVTFGFASVFELRLFGPLLFGRDKRTKCQQRP
jgi:hypothetical protein